MIRAVFFDVGETLVCEDAVWRAWADHYGVPALTFMGALGAVIERRAHHKEVFRYFGDDPAAIGESPHAIGPADLYPDAVPCLRALKEAGYTGYLSSEYEGERIPWRSIEQVRRQHSLMRQIADGL